MAKLSYIDKYNNRTLAEVESDLKELYTTAYKEAMDEIAKYWSDFESRYMKEQTAYKEGKYTDDQWKAWIHSQQARGERLERISSNMAHRLAETNQIAADYVNGRTPQVYAENANYEAYALESDYPTKIAGAFELVDEETMRNLASETNQVEFRAKWKELNPNMQRDYDWNFRRINNSLQQGLLRGESITKIADRFMQVQGNNYKAAVRNARTAVTSAQNAGRMDTFEKAEAMGLDIMKQWLSISDERTRDSHADLNGKKVKLNDPFPNGCMYPGDPKGRPEEVYNCRCTMIRARGKDARELSDEEYEEWKDKKRDDDTFEPAKSIKEVEDRVSSALGIPKDNVKFGRMELDLANEYLEGVEQFAQTFPQISGLYTAYDNKVGGGQYNIVLGVNKIRGKGRFHNGTITYDVTDVLSLKSAPRSEIDEIYKRAIASRQQYEVSSPKATALHELVHGMDRMCVLKENGGLVNGRAPLEVERSKWYDYYEKSIAPDIIHKAKMDVFGIDTGAEVLDGIQYLGRYAMTDSEEMLAQAVSYEMVNPSSSDTFSKRVYALFVERIKEAFK